MAYASLRGDTKKLRGLVAGLERLTSQRWKTETNRQLAEETLSRVQAGFASSRDPYGRPWKPLKHRVGQPLRDSGALMKSIRVQANSRSFVLTARVVYAATHQYGRGPIPRRQYLPSADRLPRAYRSAYVSILRERRREALGR